MPLVRTLRLAGLALCVAGCVASGAEFRDAGDAVNRGRALLAAGETEAAADAFQVAAIKAPDDAIAQGYLGETLYRLGRLRQAEPHLRRAVELDPALIPAWNNLGLVLLDTGREREAARVLRRAFALDSGRTDAIRLNLARAMEESGEDV